MTTRGVRPATQMRTIVGLDPQVADALRARLPEVADRVVLTIIDEVPSYAGAFSGRMGEVIRNAVQLALGGFLTLATRQDGKTPPKAPAIEGAYQLGRGEARSGRTVEALLAAYRVGARVSWRDMADAAVEAGIAAAQLARFAELVFAYIDELSASSVAGHTDELESSGRVRQRNLERLARALLTGAPADAVTAAAERADWEPPGALTAVVLPESQVSHALTALDPGTLQPTDEVPGAPDGHAVLLVPGSGGAGLPTYAPARPARHRRRRRPGLALARGGRLAPPSAALRRPGHRGAGRLRGAPRRAAPVRRPRRPRRPARPGAGPPG